LDKEIKELQEKLLSGELSEEEFARVFERLQALTNLKFKLQMAVTGWIVTMFAEMFGVELAAIVEASTEEDKKAEKTSLKEENKEVYGNVEIKVDEREKPKVPVSLFEVSPGFVRPVPLSRPELDLLSNSLKGLMPPMFKEVNENLEVKEAKPKVEEEKKAKPEAPKVAVCPSKVPEKKPVASGIKIYSSKGLEKNINFEKCDTNTSVNGRGTTSTNKCGTTNDFKEKELKPTNEQNFDGKESKSPDKQKTDDSYAKLAKKVAERNARRSSANIKHDYPIDNWQAPSETNNNGKSSAASDAQPPKRLTNDVKVEKCVEGPSVGKT
ncbi:gas vesicle protein GvpG, partial [Wolbachia endosymbiont of Nasonia giraulti]|uniref:hypothetical protein n=1 Tax=Wolbachia endosymbiont of Nasonia giraulti TaxID=180838 RepID=UPI003A8C7661